VRERLARIARELRRNPGLLLETMGLAVAVEARLRRLSFTQVLSQVTEKKRRSRRVAGDLSPETVRRAIQIAFRLLPFESTCLKQALIFCRIYQRRGLTAILRKIEPGQIQTGDQNVILPEAWIQVHQILQAANKEESASHQHE